MVMIIRVSNWHFKFQSICHRHNFTESFFPNYIFSLNEEQLQTVKYFRPYYGGENPIVYLKCGTVNMILYV